jgi:hypothetical protein
MTTKHLSAGVTVGVAILIVTIGPACSGSSQAKPCPSGAERCACYPNLTCNAGLECRSDLCVSLSAGGSSGSSRQDADVTVTGGRSFGGAPGTGGSGGAGGVAGTGGGSSPGGAMGGNADVAAETGGSTGGSPDAAGGNGGATDASVDAAGGSGGSTDASVEIAGESDGVTSDLGGASGGLGGVGAGGGVAGASGGAPGGGGTVGGTGGTTGGAGGSPGPNLVPNGDFSNGQTGWQVTNVANASGDASDGSFCFGYGDSIGYATLGTTGPISLRGGTTYEFSFRAWTTVAVAYATPVRAKVGDASPPYVDYTTFSPPVNATPTDFSQLFTPTADVTAGIAFITSATERGTTCIDNVSLRASQ